MSIRSKFLFVGLLGVGMVPGPAFASHNDGQLTALRVTVANVVGGSVTVTISGTGNNSSALPSMRLGSQFFYDGAGALDNWTQTNTPPAIDWGDGNSLANTGIAFTNRTNTTGGPVPQFSGQFMHTYSAPGSYTIRAFGTNIYGSTGLSGNEVYRTSPGFIRRVGTLSSSSSYGTGFSSRSGTQVVIGLTNSAQVTVASQVPTTSGMASTLLGLLLALVGIAVIRRN